MKVLVTGGTGFVGSHVIDELLKKNYDVRAIARKSSSTKWIEGKNVEIFHASLNDKSSLIKALDAVSAVIHVGGLTAARNLEEFMEGNYQGTKNLIDAIFESGAEIKKFLFVSSQAAVGPSKSLNEPSKEECEYKPLTAYGKSKMKAEQLVISYKDKLPITVVRPPAVYGERDSAILTFFQAMNNRLGTLIGFDDKYVSLVHVRDLARGIVIAFEAEKSNGEVYFISSKEFYSWSQIISITEKIIGKKAIRLKLPHCLVLTIAGISEFFGKFASKPPVLNYEKGIDITQKYWICSPEKAKKEIGYEQEISIEQGIRETIDWYKQNKWL